MRPYQHPPPHPSQQQYPQQPLHRAASNISALSDPGYTPYDTPPSYPAQFLPQQQQQPPHQQHQLRGRESLVSLDSQRRYSAATDPGHLTDESRYHSSPAAPVWPGSFSYSGATGGYSPVSGGPAPGSYVGRKVSMGNRKSSYASSLRHAPVPEEDEYDLSLLRSAAPMGSEPRYDAIPEEEPVVPMFDVTTALGPMDSHDAAFIKKLQDEEAKGHLTGGLGQGFTKDSRVRVRDQELLTSPTAMQRSLTRSFTRRRSIQPPSRTETIREVGQDEANRRGEVIEVVMDHPAGGADLSNMEGSHMLFDSQSRRATTFGLKEQSTQVFYPQPNWRPFAMRWPYLTLLILLSIALGAMQEILFRHYRDTAILKFKSPDDVKPGLYFAVKFAPTLSAVVYGVLWQFTDFEVRRLEAYYQLSKPGGALAAESINVDYVTSFNLFRPFRAIHLGQYAVAISSIATTLAVSLVPTFAAASVVLNPSRDERLKNPGSEKLLNFSATWSRLLTATLARRRSGLLADVRGIAGLASMAVVSHILMDFKDMDTAKHKDIHHKLKHNRYMLRNSSLAPDDENPATSQERDRFQEAHLSENPHPLMLRPTGWVPFIIGLLAFTGFIPTFLFTPADILTDKAPWLVTALAVCLKLSWNALETAVRMMEPYYILSKRHAPPSTLMLDYTALPFGYLPLRALFNGHFLVFAVGFGSVMAEFLTILVSGLATVDGKDFLMEDPLDGDQDRSHPDKGRFINSGQETFMSFFVSFGLSVFILLYMAVTACVVFFRRRHPFLPRQPNTIASVLAFIHQSKMLYDFVGTSKYSSAEMTRKLADGKSYGLGWFVGRDGQTHCGVDQEELTSNYKHGVDFSQRNQPWNMQWDVL
ncbi:spray [Purpureocillium lilacinum]|uniref:Spray n=1 Tax=Purpureocillium lilacinum TaxID=33203 RepID=A0A179GYF8_PURLI|nr:spray [Purpureocillium lilacinum]OAQ82924.1 spray [Purpureocillium lilacinum]